MKCLLRNKVNDDDVNGMSDDENGMSDEKNVYYD